MLDLRLAFVIALVGLTLAGGPAFAQTASVPAPKPNELRLRGLSAEESADVITKLKAAQIALRRGDKVFFQLLSGAPASYAMTKTSPRDAFLSVDFDKTWEAERLAPENPSWKPHKLTLAPEGLGRLTWDIEVVLGFYGQLERVEMFNRPPHPF